MQRKAEMGVVLVACRGEMAVRIIRTCKKVGLKTIAVYAQNDEKSLHVRLADQSVCIGPRAAQLSYLNIKSMIAAAKALHADYIHPGVGFLSENADFAQACLDENIRFVGPTAQCMRLIEDKQAAREIFEENGFPVVPGSDGTMDTLEAGLRSAAAIGFPLMIKASKGGGGKGIRIVSDKESFEREYPLARSEAQQAFGDSSVYLEKYLPQARHIEVQILGDMFGNVLHLGTRECSLQRKNQKLIEEAPAPFVDEDLLEQIQKAAVGMARCVGYQNAGTIEFLLGPDNQFYFMEMNARLQVEHGVTECVFGLDLVKAQLQVAMGHRLNIAQSDLKARGHAIECRINAEDIMENFRPSPGVITDMTLPCGIGVRVDTGYLAGDEISPYYDSMIMKIICSADTRQEASNTADMALSELSIQGVANNAVFAQAILNDDDFIAGRMHTKWIEQTFLPRFLRGTT